MEQNERIAVIREKFPGYTKPLDSMCKKPGYYGIRRTSEAEALIADNPCRKREANYKLSVRIPLGYVNMAEFRQQLIEMGYCNFTVWVLRCIRRQQEEYKKERPPQKTGANPPPQLYTIRGGMSSDRLQRHR